MARHVGKVRLLFRLKKRLQVRLASDEIMLTMLGYEATPKGSSFNDSSSCATVYAP